MKKENRTIMLIGVVSIIALCVTVVAVFKYLLVPVPEQFVTKGAVKQESVSVTEDQMTDSRNTETKTVSNSLSNVSAFEKTVQEFREKTALSPHVNDAVKSISPAPEKGRAAIAATASSPALRNMASSRLEPTQDNNSSSVPTNAAFVRRPTAGYQIRDSSPSGESARNNHNPGSVSPAITDNITDTEQEGKDEIGNVSVSRSRIAGDIVREELNVTLSISINGGTPNGLIVREYIPEGWEVLESTLPYRNYDPATGEVKWLLMGQDIRSMEITYKIGKKETSAAEASFHGNYLYNSANGERITMQIDGVSGV